MHFTVAVELPAQTWTLAVSRRIIGELLTLAAVCSSTQDDLAVAVTEACSNVVRHAPTGGPYRLAVDVDDERCVVEVRDAGPGFDPTPPWRSNSGEGGRGLLLIHALVDDVRWERRPGGMTVIMIKYVRPRVKGTVADLTRGA
jgi:serine/threonine-protein kinase RsbW